MGPPGRKSSRIQDEYVLYNGILFGGRQARLSLTLSTVEDSSATFRMSVVLGTLKDFAAARILQRGLNRTASIASPIRRSFEAFRIVLVEITRLKVGGGSGGKSGPFSGGGPFSGVSRYGLVKEEEKLGFLSD
jgi:hypothetical protein